MRPAAARRAQRRPRQQRQAKDKQIQAYRSDVNKRSYACIKVTKLLEEAATKEVSE